MSTSQTILFHFYGFEASASDTSSFLCRERLQLPFHFISFIETSATSHSSRSRSRFFKRTKRKRGKSKKKPVPKHPSRVHGLNILQHNDELLMCTHNRKKNEKITFWAFQVHWLRLYAPNTTLVRDYIVSADCLNSEHVSRFNIFLFFLAFLLFTRNIRKSLFFLRFRN